MLEGTCNSNCQIRFRFEPNATLSIFRARIIFIKERVI